MLQAIREGIHQYSPQAIAGRIWQDPRGAAQTADDAVRAMANTVTFGQADRLAGYMGGEGTEAEVAKSELARQRSPVASTVGDIAGGVALPGFGAEALAAKMGSGLAGRAAAYGLTGAATGAAQGAGNTYTGNTRDYITNALIGGAFGGPLGAAGGAVFGARPAISIAKTPTVPELHGTKTAAYDALAANPARYDAQHLAQRANDLEQRFWTQENFGREYSPVSFKALDQMRRPYAAAVQASPSAISTITPANIDFVRKGLNRIPLGEASATDRASGRLVKSALDDFLERPPLGAVMPGSEAAARRASAQAVLARESNAGYKRAVVSDALIRRAEGAAGPNASPLDIEAALRSQYRANLAPDKRTGRSPAQNQGFNPAEIGLMDAFSKGVDTPVRNAIRWAARNVGANTKFGLAQGAVGAGAGYFAPEGTPIEQRLAMAAALPTLGAGTRLVGNRIARNAVQNIDEALRQRNPLYQFRAMNAPMASPSGSPATAQAMRDAVAATLIKRQIAPDQQE
jgi:hypothetical protein